MTTILEEPPFHRQNKMCNCWFACLRMLVEAHGGSSNIVDDQVKKLQRNIVGHFKARSYLKIPQGFLDNNGLRATDKHRFDNTSQIEDFLKLYGPFVGGGNLFKPVKGVRIGMGHAILIYGVLADDSILHHDPWYGKRTTIGGDKYLKKQDDEVIFNYRNPVIKVMQ